ncbi:patatin-like phospholipase family protein [Pseudomaricurvus sp.]|uniref:patatin-like phospholipase family protein n=1 Tax=Pseudomaricurvus sp. TaxID=2004510 RepID=UPI003F6B4689
MQTTSKHMQPEPVSANFHIIALLLAAALLLVSPLTNAESRPQADTSVCPKNLSRPCIALVLGGGGARGSAHVGVLKALEEHNVPIDMVVGTSMGAFVGGLYASGKSPEQIQELFESADWLSGYRDDLNRSQIPNRRKRQLDQYPIQLDLGITEGKIKLPLGFLQGQGMKSLVDSMLGYYPQFESFNDLPIPFRAIAADAETSEEVILSQGDLATALQVSMSIPGVVRPIELNGRLMVDGGIANNLPVSVARSLGADVVIAVNIGSPRMTREELLSGFAILRQMVGFLTQKNVAYQKSLLTEKDIYIHPALEGITTLSFEKSPAGIAAGYAEMQKQFEENVALQALIDKTRLARNNQRSPASQLLFIDKIKLDNQTRLADDYILDRMQLKAGEAYSLDDIRNGTERLYGQGTIARINTDVKSADGTNNLDIYVGEKDWGPGYLDLKMSFEDDFDSFSRYQIGGAYRLTNLSPYGAEWYTTAEFGTDKNFNSELYWPINTTGFFWDTTVELDRSVYDLNIDDISFGQLIATSYGVQGGVGWNIKDSLDVILAATYVTGTLDFPNLLASSLPDDSLDYRQAGVLAELNFDTLDDANFPRRGWKLEASLGRTKDQVDNEKDFTTQFDSEYNGVLSYQRHSLRTQLRYQSTINNDPLSLLGGFLLAVF